MYKILLAFLLLLTLADHSFAQELSVYSSPYSMDSTLSKVYSTLEKNNLKVVETTEYASEKEEKKFSGTIYVIGFESPAAMDLASCEPTAMLDMPLKLILWTEYGDTYIGFMPPREMKRRFMVRECEDVLNLLSKTVLKVVNDVIRKK
ncbi:MAG: DUF302 domain-containing protein [Cyclobacteriaceae bacterium]